MKVMFLVRRLVLLVSVGIGAWQYARSTFYGSLEHAEMIVYGLNSRPYVYRALVPWLARCLTELGLRADVALSVVVVLCAIGAVYAFEYFFLSFKR